MKRKLFIICTVNFILMILLAGCMKADSTRMNTIEKEEAEEREEAKDLKGTDSFTSHGLKFVVNYGFDGFVKFGQYFRIQGTITNQGKERDGIFQVVIPGEEKDNGAYQQKIHLKSHDSGNVEFVIPMDGVNDQFQYSFIEEDKTIVEKMATVKLLQDSQDIFFGVLTNNQEKFRYLEDGDKKLYYLSKDNFPDDSLVLESFDGIIIDDYNADEFSESQYTALLQWVKEGGSLILDKNSSGYFDDSLGKGSQNRYFTKYNLKFGNIIVLNEELDSLEQQEYTRTELWKEIVRNLGESKSLNRENKYGGSYYNYRIKDILSIPESREIPKAGGYGIVLGIYVFLIGPLLYLVLKKKDKRHLTWILVPVIGVVFTFIIYALGNTTRITKPFGRYLTYATVGEDGFTSEHTYFSFTSPYNREYKVTFDDGYNVSIVSNQYGYMYMNQKDHDYSDYTKLVEQEEGKTSIFLKGFSSFAPLYFTVRRNTAGQGTYDYLIQDNMEKITGEFTSHLGYDLEYTGIVCNGTILPVGKIRDGETVSIKSTPENNYSTINSIYFTDVLDKIAGGTPQSKDGNLLKRHEALAAYMEDSMVNQTNDNYLIGIPDKKEEKNSEDSLNIESRGMKVIVIPLNVINVDEDGEESIGSIDCYATDTDGYSINMYRYMPDDVIDIRYTFGKEDKIKSIQYLKRGNLEFHEKSKIGFYGSVYFYNNRTRDYDPVFESGTPGSVTDMAPYLDHDNNLIVRYQSDGNKLKDMTVTIPVLAAKKEVH